MRKAALPALALALVSLSAAAQETKPLTDPAMAGLRPVYGRVKDINIRAAEKMPEENYGFKPTPEVKTFGQFVGHLADSNVAICKLGLGEPFKVNDENEKTKTSKADLVKALKDSYAFCDKVMAMSDADLGKAMKFFGADSSRFASAGLVIGHGFEHYGNMVTYMRIKGLVPPSSETPPAKPAEKAEAKTEAQTETKPAAAKK
ncbi:MAG: DinB family protein [Acidobacteria bacterium]|nr:DinB family protein [Acidobacteriota bacterium]